MHNIKEELLDIHNQMNYLIAHLDVVRAEYKKIKYKSNSKALQDMYRKEIDLIVQNLQDLKEQEKFALDTINFLEKL
jgi:tripartite-type tricarboxylate transporter receptor subunit TctC